MSALVVNLKKSDDPQDVVYLAVEAIASGKLVAFPTETVYGVAASALNVDAVERLFEVKGRDITKPFALAVKSLDDCLDYAPDMSPLARRLARRCWPGPVTLVLEINHPDSVIYRLPAAVQKLVVSQGCVGFRVPAHPVALNIMRLSAGPLALTSANRSGEPEATAGDQVVQQLGDGVDLVIDDGSCRFGQSSTVLKVGGNQYKILREGVVSEAAIQQMSVFHTLLVCTGNTCRSPMAELLLKQQLADKLSCSIEQLREHRIQVSSAGIAAMPSGRPSPQSVEVLKEKGLDLSSHSSQPVSDHLIRNADLVLTMTNGHRKALLQQWPELHGRTFVLREDQYDVSDPIGHGTDVYRACAEQIEQNLALWIDKILEQAKAE
ncbi:MAG TPA: L-threonylcarbamoyladenylate synthase [Pirellulaceae bacterium]|nr:L-threonylcarbamoyladenylate synthase [Pirellulaceae bacterium]HMO92555.1 L-threonylcarbamoyladenylate synthase [Pirellulaceae bacterium]HMP68963.1 L-threonylcarbamoyladenylate synthase [Pirellulaceae bacterium]